MRVALVEAMSDAVTAAHDALNRAHYRAEADALTDAWEAVRTEPGEPDEVLYEKCADCHLFVEPNAAASDFDVAEGIAPYDHLHRGDDADEALDGSHEARPSGLKANLATWRAYGPTPMRLRFED